LNASIASGFSSGWARKQEGTAHYFAAVGVLLYSLCGKASGSADQLRLPGEQPVCKTCARLAERLSAPAMPSVAVVPAQDP